MDQTVDGAVGGCLQRVVGAVQPVLQRLQTETQAVVLKLFFMITPDQMTPTSCLK